MKNIYLLPTDKPSRLYSNNGQLHLDSILQNSNGYTINHHVYITNDEKPKYRDWCLSTDKNFLIKLVNIPAFSCDKKIILTTDQDLIKDGVQEIDDEFLEWFVKNPSCEFVETERLEDGQYFDYLEDNSVIEGIYENYKIIIPKEEPIQLTVGKEFYESADKNITVYKQETLEEAAERHYINCIPSDRHSFLAGAKWQAERMYSEEDMSKSFFQGWVTRERFDDQIPDIIYPQGLDYEEKQEYAFNLWFEQFKKK